MGRSVWNINDVGSDNDELDGSRLGDVVDVDHHGGNMVAASTGDYPVPWLANLLHSVPRFDLALKRVKSNFQPDQQSYKESLLLWSAAPFLWLFVTLLIFLIYFCCRTCQRDVDKKRRPAPCLRWSTVLFTVLTCGAIMCGFYGNEETNKGMEHTIGAVDDIIEKIFSIKRQIPTLNQSVTEVVADGVERMKHVYRASPELHPELQTQLYTSVNSAYESSVRMMASVGEIGRHVTHVNVDRLYHNVSVIQKYLLTYRRFLTMLFFGILALVCLMLLLGICNSSKCTLILFCAIGIFSLVFCWILSGIHFGFGLLTGDFCINPHVILDSTGTEQSELDVVINYYIKCDSDYVSNPFKKSLQSASDHLKSANESLTKAVNTTEKFISKSKYNEISQMLYEEFDSIHDKLIYLTAQVECTNLHKNYIKGLDNICRTTLPGVMLLVLSFAVTGLLFSILVILASLTWRNFGRNAMQEADVTKACVGGDDENGAFLLRHDEHGNSPAHTSYGRGRQGQHQRAELMGMQRRTTPPPAYNSSEFYRQYSDVSSSEEARFDSAACRDPNA